VSGAPATDAGNVVVIDGREMQPPEPLERALAALDTIPPDGELVMLLYCQPLPLFNVLRKNGYVWQERVREDGTHEIRIQRA